jgi:hypothetical protein
VEIGRYLEDSFLGLIKVLSWHCQEALRKTTKTPPPLECLSQAVRYRSSLMVICECKVIPVFNLLHFRLNGEWGVTTVHGRKSNVWVTNLTSARIENKFS